MNKYTLKVDTTISYELRDDKQEQDKAQQETYDHRFVVEARGEDLSEAKLNSYEDIKDLMYKAFDNELVTIIDFDFSVTESFEGSIYS